MSSASRADHATLVVPLPVVGLAAVLLALMSSLCSCRSQGASEVRETAEVSPEAPGQSLVPHLKGSQLREETRDVAEPSLLSAPEPTSIDGDGLAAVLKGRRGEVVLLNIWALWCAPCRAEMPELLEARRRYQASGFGLVLVSADSEDSKRDVVDFLSKRGVDFPTYISGIKLDALVAQLGQGWSGDLPASFLIDAEGEVVGFWEGRTSVERLHERIDRALDARE